MDIKILSEEESLSKLANKSFSSIWKQLAKNSEDLTLIQEYEFASAWYQSYLKDYKPMIIVGLDDAANIVGILPLAIARCDGALSHAGQDQAEYNGWICKQGNENEFLTQSLIKIKQETHVKEWQWTWMPPKTDASWLNSDALKQQGIYINEDTCESPIYDLNDTKRIDKIKKSKSMKSKNNRLNRKGELRLERITDRATTEKIMADIISQCNFRHLSLYNYMPFESDQNKAAWHLNQMDNPSHVHFTVLWQGDRLLACNFGYCNDDTVMVGLFTYDPIEGANSPGNIFLIKLIEFIKQEGYKYLDLTPGGDEYKERFCNIHNELTKPMVCFNRYSQVKHYAISTLRQFLKAKLHGRFTMRDMASLQALKETGLANVLKSKVQKYSNKNSVLFLYNKISKQQQKNSFHEVVSINKYSDLLCYKNTTGSLPHKEVVHSALRKFQRGDQLYTLKIEGELLAFAWLARPGKKHWIPVLRDRINENKNQQYIYDVYINQSANLDHIFQRLIHAILDTANNSEILLLKPSWLSSDTIKSAGFIQEHSTKQPKEKSKTKFSLSFPKRSVIKGSIKY